MSSAALSPTTMNFADSSIAVTGGAGFIGANIVRSLVAAGARVTVLDDLSTGFASNLDGVDHTFVEGSIEDGSLVDQVCGPADAIVHLGAQGSVPLSVDNPQLSHAVNVSGTVNVLEAARPNDQRPTPAMVILASSAAVYGLSPELPKHEAMATDPQSPYATTKIATEGYGLAWQASYGVPVMPFRFFNVYGPFQPAEHAYAPVIPAFIGRATQGDALSVHGDGTQTRDFVHVDTVCDYIMAALGNQITSTTPVNLASGTTRSLLDVIASLEAALDISIERVHGEPRQGDIPHSSASVDVLRGLFPEIEPVSFEDGLASTLAWWGA